VLRKRTSRDRSTILWSAIDREDEELIKEENAEAEESEGPI
jgi:hypothetical protein